MASTRLLAALFSVLVIGIGLAACGGSDETTTVTETHRCNGRRGRRRATTVTGTGEAAEEEIAAPDAEAQEDIDKITSGLEETQEEADASDSDAVVEGGGGVPKLTYGEARENLNKPRYCAADVIAGRNTPARSP